MGGALGESKLFDAHQQCMVIGENGAPQALEIDLVFFDDHHQHKNFPYIGDFQYFSKELANGLESGGMEESLALARHSREVHVTFDKQRTHVAPQGSPPLAGGARSRFALVGGGHM